MKASAVVELSLSESRSGHCSEPHAQEVMISLATATPRQPHGNARLCSDLTSLEPRSSHGC